MEFKHRTKVFSIGLRYDGVRLWRWTCPHWNRGWNRDCRGWDYGSWEMAVRDAIKHAVDNGKEGPDCG